MSYIPPGHENDYLDKDNFDYQKAAEDLWDAGSNRPDEIWEYRSKRGATDILSEYGLDTKKYMNNNSQNDEYSYSFFEDYDRYFENSRTKITQNSNVPSSSRCSSETTYTPRVTAIDPDTLVPDGYPIRKMFKESLLFKLSILPMLAGAIEIFWREMATFFYGFLGFCKKYNKFPTDYTENGLIIFVIGFFIFYAAGKYLDRQYGKEHMVKYSERQTGFSIIIRVAIAFVIFILSGLPAMILNIELI